MKVRKLTLKLCAITTATAFLFSCSSPHKTTAVETSGGDPKVASIIDHRKEKDQEFLTDKSPLQPKDKKTFKGLHYYPIDLSYQVKARFVKEERPSIFKMKTTTARLPEYQKFGDVFFTLQGRECKLEVYQSLDLMKTKEYENHLFIPFTDESNGTETYEVGRYLELSIPSTEKILLDFNLSYNPYCSYGGGYSCPIPPEVNHLPFVVAAGEKKFH